MVPVGRNDSDFLNAGKAGPQAGLLACRKAPMSREYVIHVNVKRKVARCIGRYARDCPFDSDTGRQTISTYALTGRQFTKNTPTTQTAMPTSASGASFSPNSANAISAVTGGVR